MAGPDIDIRGLVTCFFIAEDESGICDLVLANKSGGCIVERRWASAMASRDGNRSKESTTRDARVGHSH